MSDHFIHPDNATFLKTLIKDALTEVTLLNEDAKLPPFLSVREVVRLTKAKTLVYADVKTGKLRLSEVGGREVIRKKDYLKWRDG